MAINFNRRKEEVELPTRKKEVTYKMTILEARPFDVNEADELKPFYSEQIPKKGNIFVDRIRVWFFINSVKGRVDCYKSKYYKKTGKCMINFKELGTIEDIPLELVLEHMPQLETSFDGWALLKFEGYDRLAIHDNYRDKFVDIALGCHSENIYIKYERVK